ncbi:glycosyl transferase family 2 [Fictibacillus arsenicus]|uniref:Glycosyl transferase family 2 n=1 Tax=Fictibacillus arsenicus TaxID=255247 RepID=A0A1B1Z3Z9_9BACL|nr:glycosyltransferase [Fictibacillus arsenicus]ANX12076.1 glycosyl transferase family 2 [Fictibacillus arsenicus]
MKVSIIIPFYNCAYIDQAIKSALSQTYKNIEIIVVNDGSTKHVEKIKPFLNQIKYLEKPNGGTGSALNLGIRHATGSYFAWLSSDDIYYPQKIEKQLQFMHTTGAMVSYTNYFVINELGKKISSPMGVYFHDNKQFLRILRRRCFINGCTVMMKMEIFKEFGLFDESLKFTQDYDYWLRIVPRYKFHYFSEPLIHYRMHVNMGTKKYKKEQRVEIQETIRRHKDAINHTLKMLYR